MLDSALFLSLSVCSEDEWGEAFVLSEQEAADAYDALYRPLAALLPPQLARCGNLPIFQVPRSFIYKALQLTFARRPGHSKPREPQAAQPAGSPDLRLPKPGPKSRSATEKENSQRSAEAKKLEAEARLCRSSCRWGKSGKSGSLVVSGA